MPQGPDQVYRAAWDGTKAAAAWTADKACEAGQAVSSGASAAWGGTKSAGRWVGGSATDAWNWAFGVKHRQPPEIRGTGYVVETLEAALWAFHNSTSFRQGALLAINLGDDADTTGAIYGQLAGAHYGDQAIPASWREKLAHRDLLESFADKLLKHRPQPA